MEGWMGLGWKAKEASRVLVLWWTRDWGTMAIETGEA